jgi:hypothetical protein
MDPTETPTYRKDAGYFDADESCGPSGIQVQSIA